MEVIRAAQALFVLWIGAFAGLVALNNVVDYGTNLRFVQHVLGMDTTFEDSRLRRRAITSPALHHAAYWAIIAAEALTAALPRARAAGMSAVTSTKWLSFRLSVRKRVCMQISLKRLAEFVLPRRPSLIVRCCNHVESPVLRNASFHVRNGVFARKTFESSITKMGHIWDAVNQFSPCAGVFKTETTLHRCYAFSAAANPCGIATTTLRRA